MAYPEPYYNQYTMSPTPDKRGSPAFPEWGEYAQSLTLDPNAYPNLRRRAEQYGELSYRPGFRELDRQKRQYGREYGWAKGEVEPQYQRLVSEMRHGLRGQKANYALQRGTAMQDYDYGSGMLGDQYLTSRKNIELDLSRRGLFRSGVLARANVDQTNKYMQQQGELQRSRGERLSDIDRLRSAAVSRAGFDLSDAQRARTDQMQKLYEAYQGRIDENALRRQGLSEEQGLTSATRYGDLMDNLQRYALQARQQGLSETKFHHDAYWAQKDSEFQQKQFDENVRQWGLEHALRVQAQNRAYGGGGSSNWQQGPKDPPPGGDTFSKEEWGNLFAQTAKDSLTDGVWGPYGKASTPGTNTPLSSYQNDPFSRWW